MYFQVYLLQQKHKHLQVVLQKQLHIDGFPRQPLHISAATLCRDNCQLIGKLINRTRSAG